jgi:hypothetical protein
MKKSIEGAAADRMSAPPPLDASRKDEGADNDQSVAAARPEYWKGTLLPCRSFLAGLLL